MDDDGWFDAGEEGFYGGRGGEGGGVVGGACVSGGGGGGRAGEDVDLGMGRVDVEVGD